MLQRRTARVQVGVTGKETALKAGLQYTQETGAKPRDFARTQAKKCLQSMRVCLQNFPVCVTRNSSRRPPRSPTTRLP